MQPQTSPDEAGIAEHVDGQPGPIRMLFVANRGEIARRIDRTARRLGIEVIAPPAEGAGAVDLLDIAAVVAAARAVGADALHPGYGFLAENAEFAEAVIKAGIRWVGPPPAAIRAMGDKAAARRLATNLQIPVIPGYDDADQANAALERAATSIGYPLLIKPAAGGGGKGMRVVRTADRLSDAVASARREANVAFGDDRLILERLVEGPRHVEIQVLFDRHGAGIHLGERDCSVQRRHQKVLEETPSPAVDPALRRRLGQAALALAAAVGYESAGTCEFLLTDRDEVFFLEMNTRLQVEHPVTELVTGLDLVEEQLRIAAGAPVRWDQAAADAARADGGHAIEVRLYAEDAEAGFLPATGRIERLQWPAGEGIRVDPGIDEGTEVGPRFDPMLAKIIAHGQDRDAALDRLIEALDRTVVLGLTTNLRFLRWLVREPAVRDGQVRIDTLERVWPPDDWQARTGIPDATWQAAGRALLDNSAGSRDGWRLNAARRVRLVADGQEERTIVLGPEPDAAAGLLVRRGDIAHVDLAGRSLAISLAPPPDVDRAARAAAATHQGGPAELVAPMPGAVIAVHRAVGDRVEAGDPVVTLEAMKMEHAVASAIDGTISEVGVRPGDQVTRGQSLATVEP
ncbi:MAG TPA: biotin carboxylase N-terminal domain-containing protein [Candidatus Eisenbacteria bacterium]|nr:biotin carboxylase N-terminal domain-containing protein [Candidatus Eisenbacteria bacterium]